jgi:hypothetical protein
VGLEIEFGDLSLERVLEVAHGALGGTAQLHSRTQGEVEGTRFGAFKVEFDSTPLKHKAYLKPFEQLGLDADSTAAQLIEDSVLRVAREVVPVEVVAPPIAWTRLHELDPLWRALIAAGAQDTRASFLYAFGMQLNPEAPDLSVETALSHLRAFLLLEPWLTAQVDVDFTRKLMPYIKPFPQAYVRELLDPEYAPEWSAFIADYVAHNPTRNRPLDMLPLMVEATGSDLSGEVEDWALVQARPTFHYRLPNCDLNQPGWSPAVEWNRWLEVERLAAAPLRLRTLSEAYLQRLDEDGPPDRAAWLSFLEQQLELPRMNPSPTSLETTHGAP